MKLVVVSDLHIRGPDDPLYRSLLNLLRDRCETGDMLVLGGDIFDLFVGNKPLFLDRYAEFFRELRSAGARGITVHYIEGNHDFQIRRAFGELAGVEVHPESVSLEMGGRQFFVAHGDLVDRTDYGYLALRAFFRSPPLKAFVALAPGKWVESIGKLSADYSREQKPRLPSDLPIERRERLRTAYRSFAAEKLTHGYDYVVLGHCHDLDEMSFVLGGRQGQYINVGYPRAHGSYLVWRPGDEKITREPLPGA